MLLYVKLLKLDLPIVESGAEHDYFSRAIAPGRIAQFNPNRGGCAHEIVRIAAKGDFARVERAPQLVGETDCLRGLRKRDVAGRASKVPNGMPQPPFVGKTGANFAAECIEVELKIGALFAEMGKIDGGRLQIQPASERDAAEREPVILPFGRTAQVRESLVNQRRGDCDLAGSETARLDFAPGKGSVT